MNIKRQTVIRRGCLTVDPQRYTVALDGEESDLYPKEFDVLYLWMKYSDWEFYRTDLRSCLAGAMIGCEHVVYNLFANSEES